MTVATTGVEKVSPRVICLRRRCNSMQEWFSFLSHHFIPSRRLCFRSEMVSAIRRDWVWGRLAAAIQRMKLRR